MSRKIESVCVFCGSSAGVRPAYAEAARRLGAELGRRELRLVYGGGDIGLMGILARAAAGAGAEVVGVIPRKLDALVDQPELAELRVTEGMHERKATMASLADAFIALPGGIGTLEELFEVWTWRQIGYHDKPLGLLEVEGFWEPLGELVSHLAREGFLRLEILGDLPKSADPGELIELLAELPPPSGYKLAERRGRGRG
jgi:uncharacterized protein (TIGR00730 family)